MGSTSKTVDGVLALESSTRRALLASSSKESAPGNEVAWLSHASSGGSSNTSMSSGRSDGLLDAEERGRALKAAGIDGVAMRGLGGNESSSSISNACTSVSTTGMWADEIQQARARVCSLVETTLNLEHKHTHSSLAQGPWKSKHDSPAQKPRAVRHLYSTVPVPVYM